MIKFSVIIPAYNCSEFISETIESVLSQTYSSYEIIVVDDGSTDSTIEILSKFSDKIKIHKQLNSGVSVARNTGARLSCGEYLAFLDSDDIWLENKLHAQYSKLIDGFDMCYSNKYNFGEIGDLPLIQTDVFQMPEGDIFEKLLCCNFITNSSVVIKKAIFDEFGGFNEKYFTCEDWDLWLRISTQYKIGVCLEPLVKYRLHKGCKSRNYKRQATTREQIIRSILNTTRGLELSKSSRAKAWSNTFRTAAWASASFGDLTMSLNCFLRALTYWPFDIGCWYDLARILAGRVNRIAE